MPKTTDKRTAARHAARVQRAHTTKQESTAIPRRQPTRRVPARERTNIFARYPVGITLLFLLIIGITGYTLHANQLWFFAPKPPAPRVYPALPASAAKSPCQAVAKYLQTTTPIPDSANIQRTYSSAPPMVIDKDKVYCVGVNTSKGFMLLELDPTLAPNTVNNFIYLADHHFYDGLTFHRVEHKGQTDSDGTTSTLELIQGGDPSGNGSGGPGYKFDDELNQNQQYITGSVAMANSGANTNGSQFFICTNNDNGKNQLTTHSYSLFGNLVKGIDVANNIKVGDKMLRVVTMAVDGPPSLPPAPTPTATSTAAPTASPTSAPSATATP